MTETDTSRVNRPCPNCGVSLNGWSGLRHCGHYTTHSHADCIKNLRHRAEKAEAERDALLAAAEELRADMVERAELKMDTIRGVQYRVVNAGNSAWAGFCAALNTLKGSDQ